MEADALAGLVASLAAPVGTQCSITVIGRELVCPKNNLRTCLNYSIQVYTNVDVQDWRFPFIDYTVYRILPEDPKKAISIKRWSL